MRTSQTWTKENRSKSSSTKRTNRLQLQRPKPTSRSNLSQKVADFQRTPCLTKSTSPLIISVTPLNTREHPTTIQWCFPRPYPRPDVPQISLTRALPCIIRTRLQLGLGVSLHSRSKCPCCWSKEIKVPIIYILFITTTIKTKALSWVLVSNKYSKRLMNYRRRTRSQ